MLCSRSASFTSSTRTSLPMATSSLRTFSALSRCRSVKSSLLILVSPSTSSAISSPNWAFTWGRVMRVSSTTSCSSPQATLTASSRQSARLWATDRGWKK